MSNTNGQNYNLLSSEEKEEFRNMYKNHPLFDYIDWDGYYNSEGGFSLDFVKFIDKYKNEDEKEVFVLEKMVIDEHDYLLIFVCGENNFYKVPDNGQIK